jgi:hypothetical protein
MLAHPDPSLAFIVEVDASEAGIGAVLSQRSVTPQKLCPCAFFSKKLSSAERNYDVGDRELLAVVKALKVWRHWLEGAKHPFLIWTDHRNLEYIRAARRMNPRQAGWAMFFTLFVFTLSSTYQVPRTLRQTHFAGCMTQRSSPRIPPPYFRLLAWWHRWCGRWTRTLSGHYVQSPSSWMSVRSVCCPRPFHILGPHVNLLWSSWHRSESALC